VRETKRERERGKNIETERKRENVKEIKGTERIKIK